MVIFRRTRRGTRKTASVGAVFHLALLIAVPLASVLADEPAAPTAGGSAPALDTRVAAKVNEIPVTVGESLREVERVLPGGEVPTATRQWLQAKAIEQLIDRQLVLKQLSQAQAAAAPQEVDLFVQRLTKQLTERKSSLGEHLRRAGLDEPAFRRRVAWQISWDRYLERYLTEANLQKYFDQHRREFDGSTLHVAHLLLKHRPSEEASAITERVKKANEILAEIKSGKLKFAEACAQHSEAPTAKTGGDVGWIGRREPMPESFSRAAFALNVNEISEPVVTAIGVHLIQCLEIKSGDRDWKTARQELEPALTQYLFQYLAGRERPAAQIEYTNVAPHFKPGTEELVAP